jgi:hypothetical protein
LPRDSGFPVLARAVFGASLLSPQIEFQMNADSKLSKTLRPDFRNGAEEEAWKHSRMDAKNQGSPWNGRLGGLARSTTRASTGPTADDLVVALVSPIAAWEREGAATGPFRLASFVPHNPSLM